MGIRKTRINSIGIVFYSFRIANALKNTLGHSIGFNMENYTQSKTKLQPPHTTSNPQGWINIMIIKATGHDHPKCPAIPFGIQHNLVLRICTCLLDSACVCIPPVYGVVAEAQAHTPLHHPYNQMVN